MVEQALQTGQHLLYALKCMEHYANDLEGVGDDDGGEAMEAESA